MFITKTGYPVCFTMESITTTTTITYAPFHIAISTHFSLSFFIAFDFDLLVYGSFLFLFHVFFMSFQYSPESKIATQTHAYTHIHTYTYVAQHHHHHPIVQYSSLLNMYTADLLFSLCICKAFFCTDNYCSSFLLS